MSLFVVPFAPNSSKGWEISIPGDGFETFASREQALKFATKLAQDVPSDGTKTGYLCIEGADQRWRLFDRKFKPIT
jgi:hypothetical protein